MITTLRPVDVRPTGPADPDTGKLLDSATIARLQGAERQLWEAALRAFRQMQGKLAVVLHLSALPAPRAYHVRVARVLLEDTARRHGGQIFTMRNHDLVLLCAATPDETALGEHAPERLPQVLSGLFGADAPPGSGLTSLWRLDRNRDQLIAYIGARARLPVACAADGALRGQPVSLAALQEIIAKAPLPGLMTQRTGLSLSANRTRTLAARLAPAFQEVAIGFEALRLDPLLSHALSDPYLQRHFAERLDERILALLCQDLSARGHLLHGARTQSIPMMIELGLRAIVSPGFAEFARLAALAGLRLWIAVSLLQAGSEVELLDHARGLLRQAGCSLVLNRLDPAALDLVRPLSLAPDFVALSWSPLLRQAAASSAGFAELRRMGAERCILHGVDGEQALAWGQANGVSLFSGSFLDQAQAATRMERCHSAQGCTLRACIARAASLSQTGRAGCANPALLAARFAAGA